MDKGSLLAKETSIVFTRILEIDSKAAIKNPARQGFFIYLKVLTNYQFYLLVLWLLYVSIHLYTFC